MKELLGEVMQTAEGQADRKSLGASLIQHMRCSKGSPALLCDLSGQEFELVKTSRIYPLPQKTQCDALWT